MAFTAPVAGSIATTDATQSPPNCGLALFEESIASYKAPERTDQVLWDQANKRVYVLGGEGYIGVFQQSDADHYAEIARIPSATGAKTGILVPEINKLFVAVSPGEGKTGAAVLQFDVAKMAVAK